jgi:hypothetical protein
MKIKHGVFVVVILAWATVPSWAQGSAPLISGVYTCVDANGRKLTSDRPIPECIDREQLILNPSGTIKTKVGPSLTARERAELEQKEKREAEERSRIADEKRRDRALLTRYPNKAMHDQERQEALKQIDIVVQTAKNRLNELIKQRVTLDTEMEFYAKDPKKAPGNLRRQLDENTHNQATQRRFISDQEAEVRRVTLRFDDELVRLRQLWGHNDTPAARKPSASE